MYGGILSYYGELHGREAGRAGTRELGIFHPQATPSLHSQSQLFSANCSHYLQGSIDSGDEMSSTLHSFLSHMTTWKEEPQP